MIGTYLVIFFLGMVGGFLLGLILSPSHRRVREMTTELVEVRVELTNMRVIANQAKDELSHANTVLARSTGNSPEIKTSSTNAVKPFTGRYITES